MITGRWATPMTQKNMGPSDRCRVACPMIQESRAQVSRVILLIAKAIGITNQTAFGFMDINSLQIFVLEAAIVKLKTNDDGWCIRFFLSDLS